MGVSQMDSLRTVCSYWESLYTQVVLGKFGLVWYKAKFPKLETKPLGFWQNFPNLN
jgi:hypothetical protein